MLPEKKKTALQDVLFAVLLLACFGFSFWKCRYGFGGNDEPFYLTIAQRLWQGDALFRDEWHLSQMSGVLLLPFTALFHLFSKTGEGMILAARYYYLAAHTGIAVLLYSRLRRYGLPSVAAVLCFYLFAPFDIMACSYNTMGLDCTALTGMWLCTANGRKLPHIFAGVSLACAVLCCPVLVAAYGVYAVLSVVLRRKTALLNIKNLLWLTVGIVPVAAVFALFLLRRTGVQALLQNLPLMMQDPEHLPVSLVHRAVELVKPMLGFGGVYSAVVLSLMGLLLIASVTDRKHRFRVPFFYTGAGLTVLLFVCMMPHLSTRNYNVVMLPMALFGLLAFFLCSKKPWPLMLIYALGLLYGISLCFTSNQYYYVFTMAMAVCDLAGVLILGHFLHEQDKKIPVAVFGVVLVLMLSCQCGIKATHCFWEKTPVQTLTAQISSGAAKGVYTTPQNAATVQKMQDDLKNYKTGTPGKLLVLSNRTWCYLELPAYENAAFSGWLSGEKDTTLDRLQTYYTVNPDKVPQYIYIPKDGQWDFARILASAAENGYTTEETAVAYHLEKP